MATFLWPIFGPKSVDGIDYAFVLQNLSTFYASSNNYKIMSSKIKNRSS